MLLDTNCFSKISRTTSGPKWHCQLTSFVRKGSVTILGRFVTPHTIFCDCSLTRPRSQGCRSSLFRSCFKSTASGQDLVKQFWSPYLRPKNTSHHMHHSNLWLYLSGAQDSLEQNNSSIHEPNQVFWLRESIPIFWARTFCFWICEPSTRTQTLVRSRRGKLYALGTVWNNVFYSYSISLVYWRNQFDYV